MLLAVLVFRSFYGSSEPGTPPHHDSIPSNPLRPHPCMEQLAVNRAGTRLRYNLILTYRAVIFRPDIRQEQRGLSSRLFSEPREPRPQVPSQRLLLGVNPHRLQLIAQE